MGFTGGGAGEEIDQRPDPLARRPDAPPVVAKLEPIGPVRGLSLSRLIGLSSPLTFCLLSNVAIDGSELDEETETEEETVDVAAPLFFKVKPFSVEWATGRVSEFIFSF